MTALITASLRRFVTDTWTPPFPQLLPSDADRYASEVSWLRVARRRALRELNLLLHGQRGLVRTAIDPVRHRRLLWIHQGTPQVGDSLMDLAARTLLQGRCERLDLLTEPHLLPLYRTDRVFSQIGSVPAELPGRYDLVLLHSTSSRSLRDKLAHYRPTPFVHIQGCFTGPEFNRTLYGYFRLAQLLQLPLDATELNAMARPSMWSSAAGEQAVDLPAGAVVVAVGGVRGWRTYDRWPQVLQAMAAAGFSAPVVLVGSDNGMSQREEIFKLAAGLTLIDRVAKHSLTEVHALMQRAALVMCADGGLLHVAHAAHVPVVALFAGVIDPSFRVTAANRTHSLYGMQAVNDVAPEAVAAAALNALAAGTAS